MTIINYLALFLFTDSYPSGVTRAIAMSELDNEVRSELELQSISMGCNGMYRGYTACVFILIVEPPNKGHIFLSFF